VANASAKLPSSRKLFLLIVSCATFLAVLYGARTIFADIHSRSRETGNEDGSERGGFRQNF